MDNEYFGKHAKIDLIHIPNAEFGDSFHGEVWVRCPHCNKAHEMVGATPVAIKGKYRIYKCSCGELFKDY